MSRCAAPRWFDQPFALYEDNSSAHPRLLLLTGLQQQCSARHADELAASFAAMDGAHAGGHWLSIACAYELGFALEPSLGKPRIQSPTPLIDALSFSSARELEGETALDAFWAESLAALHAVEQEAAILALQPDWNEAEHAAATRQILAAIGEGECYQVNLTFACTGLAAGHPLALFAHLRQTQAVPHAVLRFDGQHWTLSRSPELFFRQHGERLECRPMKGTRARADDPALDAAAANELRSSAKEIAENLMIVDLIRNDLGRLVPAGGVQVERLFEVEPYRSVWQMTSTISAAPVKASLRHCLEALFPCGSVTGAPKLAAMQIINALEASPRGLYCGALGWYSPEGAMSFNVPIRTLLLEADGRFRLNVGSAIVADSEPAAEYAECLSKLAFARPEPALQLIETLRVEADGSLPLLDGHLARLARSAHDLGFRLDIAALRQALLAAATPAEAPRRLRLLTDRSGNFSITLQPLDPLQGAQRIALASERLFSGDARLRYKTTLRSGYDAALREASAQGLFDLLYCNERDELCEGTRSNLFLETAEGEFLTPALASGLLPGVLRASLLAEGRFREARIHCDELRTARRLWMGNALRGLIPVSLERHTAF